MSPGNIYSFKVKAINVVGYSDFSDALNVIAGTTPGVPINLHAVDNSRTVIEIQWETPSDGNSEITDYQVYWDTGSGTSDPDEFVALGLSGGYTRLVIDSDLAIFNPG